VSAQRLKAMCTAIVIVFGAILITSASELAAAASGPSYQPVFLHMGGSAIDLTLDPVLSHDEGHVVDVSPEAAFLGGGYSEVGTWYGIPLARTMNIRDSVTFVAYARSGNEPVDGVSLSFSLAFSGGHDPLVATTGSIDLGSAFIEYSATVELESVIQINAGESVNLTVMWTGTEDFLDAYSGKDTIEVYYGTRALDSRVEFTADSVHVSELLVVPGMERPDSVTIFASADSAFGPGDIVNASITSNLQGDVLQLVNQLNGSQREFVFLWDYSGEDVAAGMREIIVAIEDQSGNEWRSSKEVYITPSEYEVDVGILATDVLFTPHNPTEGEDVTIVIFLTGYGTNWNTTVVGITVKEGDQVLVSKKVTVVLGKNPPLDVSWTPPSDGVFSITIEIDESGIKAPGLSSDNNIVTVQKEIFPGEEKSRYSGRVQYFWYFLGAVCLIIIFTAVAFGRAMERGRKDRDLEEERRSRGAG